MCIRTRAGAKERAKEQTSHDHGVAQAKQCASVQVWVCVCVRKWPSAMVGNVAGEAARLEKRGRDGGAMEAIILIW